MSCSHTHGKSRFDSLVCRIIFFQKVTPDGILIQVLCTNSRKGFASFELSLPTYT